MNRGLDRVWWPVVGPAVGVLLGVADSVVNHVAILLGEVGTARAERSAWTQAAEFGSLILDAGWAWAAAAVLAGWLVGRVTRGAVAGGLALVFATVTYYGMDIVFDGGAFWGMATQFWLIGSVVLGPLLGLVGALIRRPGPVGVLASLVVPVGAALQMMLLPPPAASLMALPVRLVVALAAAVAVVLIFRNRARQRTPVAA